MLTLYYGPGSSSMAPHIALHEIGEPFEARVLSLKGKQQREPGYLALNPEGKVPLLLIDGRPLTEVAAILYYLAMRFPQADLIPGDLEGQAQAVSWMSYVASTLHPARRVGVDHARTVFLQADRKLGRGGWAGNGWRPPAMCAALSRDGWGGAPCRGRHRGRASARAYPWRCAAIASLSPSALRAGTSRR